MKTPSKNPICSGKKEHGSATVLPTPAAKPRSTGTSIPTAGNARRKRHLVSVVLDPKSPEIHAGILRAARELKWEVVEGGTSHEVAFDGVLSTTGDNERWKWTRGLDCPVIRILGTTVSSASAMPVDGIATVAMDLRSAGVMSARHLLTLGVENIVFFRNFGAAGEGSFCQSFLETCRLAGKNALLLDATADKPEDRSAWLLDRVAKLPLPCAVMADHDRFAVEIIAAAGELGLRVPEDIAVLGTENSETVQKRSQVPLSSLDMNLELLGYTAARLLERSMRGDSIEPRHHFIAPKKVNERKSTATYSCEIPGISKAVLKIRSQYFQQISVRAMAKECGLSIRSLYRLYRATTGNTIGKDIMARRMEAAAEMLRDENLKLEPIAIEAGLGNAKNLCRLFKEHYGQTPGQWRASGNSFADGGRISVKMSGV